MRFSPRIHALLSTSRIANVPSVVGNTWVGVVGASIANDAPIVQPIPLTPTMLLMAAGVLLYFSGNFLNDWMDRAWDGQHRPERALPCGLFRPGLYLGISLAAGLGGLALAALANPWAGLVALGILAAITVYTVWHKQSPWAVVAMGLCRALLPVMGAVGISGTVGGLPGMFAAALFCHIAGLSLSARYESLTNPPAGASHLARLLFLATVVFAVFAGHQSGMNRFLLVGVLPYLLWVLLSLTIWRKPVPVHVSRLLAGIPLADWIILLPIALTLAQSGTSPLGLACLIIPPAAFILALLLQRVAPAT
jgi:heme O synthase-like polyprenyltransferase